jgi:predicted nucleic acid-binding protein
VTYLLDADTLNYILKSISPALERFEAATRAGASFILSPTVHYQITRYLKLKNATRVLRFYTGLVSGWVAVGLENTDRDTAADLWAQRHRVGKPIQDADLLIAVVALKTGATLVTNNVRHFDGLGLTVENWLLPEQAPGG